MNNRTIANALRQYAEWIEQHPEAKTPPMTISIYEVSAEQARVLLENGAKVEPLPRNNDIVFVTQSFGDVSVRHVAFKNLLMRPCLVNGKVAYEIRPEFAFAEVL